MESTAKGLREAELELKIAIRSLKDLEEQIGDIKLSEQIRDIRWDLEGIFVTIEYPQTMV